ncbi:MAG: hypothetical protein P4L68_08055 [Methylovirgula sp.]|nr:hypothetical protein [Methylovirgula sp.]
MPDRPITIIAPTISRVLDGTCTTLRRPRGALAACRAGDRLWIREQFRIHRDYDHISPLQALDRGATPVMSSDEHDLPDYATSDLGRRRFARELPKAWHRAHLVITSIDTIHLQSITPADAINAGFTTLDQFAQAWNAGLRGFIDQRSIRPPKWENDPAVLVLTFKCHAAPMGGEIESTAA